MKINSYYLKYKSNHALNKQCHPAAAQGRTGNVVEQWQLKKENMSDHGSGLMPLVLTLIGKQCQHSCMGWLRHRGKSKSNGSGCQDLI